MSTGTTRADPTADEELFLVVRGHAVFDVDGAQIDAPAGTFLFAPPGTRRAYGTEPGTAVLLIEGTPGSRFKALVNG